MEYKGKETKEKRQKRYREGMKYDKKKERRKMSMRRILHFI
jgi:hypothetical protein